MDGRTRIHLIRHGTVANHWRSRLYGSLDVPLSAHGQVESEAMAQSLSQVPLNLVVSSGLKRAEYAAKLLCAGRTCERRTVSALRERSRGHWAGLDHVQLERRFPGAWAEWQESEGMVTPPGGETIEEVAERVLPALDAMADEFPGGVVAAVSHLWVLRVAACGALGLGLDRCARIQVSNCGRLSLDWPPAELRSAGKQANLIELAHLQVVAAPDPGAANQP